VRGQESAPAQQRVSPCELHVYVHVRPKRPWSVN
jgi:hypothetical protein